METKTTRPPIESLACIAPECDLYGQPSQGNLTVRKVYGHEQIRYLRCTCCRTEFSERKGTALWNTKVSEVKAVSDPRGDVPAAVRVREPYTHLPVYRHE